MRLCKNDKYQVWLLHSMLNSHPVQWRSQPEGPPNWRLPFKMPITWYSDFDLWCMTRDEMQRVRGFQLDVGRNCLFTSLTSWRSLYTVSNFDDGQSPLSQNSDTVFWNKFHFRPKLQLKHSYLRCSGAPDKLPNVFADSLGHSFLPSHRHGRNQSSFRLWDVCKLR